MRNELSVTIVEKDQQVVVTLSDGRTFSLDAGERVEGVGEFDRLGVRLVVSCYWKDAK